MSYIIPSTLVYQELQNAGGAVNSTPDLDALIIGPCFNVVSYVPNSVVAQAATHVGDITNAEVNNTFNISSTFPGQEVDLPSVQVWLSQVSVETVSYSAVVNPNSNVVTLAAGETDNLYLNTGANTPAVRVGDTAVVNGFTSTVLSITDGTHFTLSDRMPASTTANQAVTVSIRQTHNDIRLTSGFSIANIATDGEVTINAGIEITYGKVVTASVYVGYRALRTDMSQTVQVLADVDDSNGKLGKPSEQNPLALGCELTFANTVTRVKAVAIGSDDLNGYLSALNLIENERAYAIVVLTQDVDVISSLRTHAEQMSVPTEGAWRVAIVNSEIPEKMNVGAASSNSPTSGNISGNSLVNNSAQFLSDKTVPGDVIAVGTVSDGVLTVTKTFVVDKVVSNQEIVFTGPAQSNTTVNYYIYRNLTREQQSDVVAGTSRTFNTRRVIHVQPDLVGIAIDGVVKYLPGYYLCCAVAGMTAGFPVQQGFTNIGVAGVADLQHSNFYFTRAQLNKMAEAGTMLFVQQSQGSLPYCRHELTTDMSVLENREFLVGKNWDFLSYFYRDAITPFIGSWNIVPDTLSAIRRTLVAKSELMKQQRLPKIGAPLLDYKINSIAQDPNNKDNANVNMSISVVYPNNYTNIYLVI